MTISFGKHKGKTLKELPQDYLEWGAKKLSGVTQEEFRQELKRRHPISTNAVSTKKLVKQDSSTIKKMSYDPLIFGKDNTENIVNITVTDDDKVYIYYADGTHEVKDYKKWYINSKQEGKPLKGFRSYRYMNTASTQFYNQLKESWDRDRWLPRSEAEGFMLLNGATYFKGMRIEDISLLSTDIEATGLDGEASDACVVLIGTTFVKNGKWTRRMFDIHDYKTDEEMLEDYCQYVNTCNPDIMLGHNIMSYDLPYMSARGELTLGRNGDAIHFNEKTSRVRKDATQQYEFHDVKIHGREVVDTLFLAIKYDVARTFPAYGLKAIEKHLKLVDDTRIEWDFTKYPVKAMYKKNFKKEIWDKFKEYCATDSDSPIKMFYIMAPSFFYMNQSVPKTFQQMINEATGSQLDAIMIRSYLQNGESIPKTSKKAEFEGAVSMGIPGIYSDVRKVDVASLYPSIMLEYEIYDKKKDPNRHLITILEYFRTERLKNKKLAKDTGDQYYDDLQGSQKILINSLYGFMGAGFLLFNYPEGAAAVTRHGREILLKAVEWATGHTLEKIVSKVVNEGEEDEAEQFAWVLGEKKSQGLGYTLVNVDTDSISYTNGKPTTKEQFLKEIDSLNLLYPENIKFEDDGVYDKVIVIRAKNYVMKMGNKLVIKGSALKDQKKEPALKQFLNDVVTEMLGDNRQDQIVKLYNDCCNEAKRIKDINRWTTKKTFTAKVRDSDRKNEVVLMDAVNEAIDKKVLNGIQEGDKVWVYSAIDGMVQKEAKGELQFYKKTNEPMMIENRILRVPQLWKNDHDVWHYVARVHKTMSILENVIDMDKFIDFSKKKNRESLK